MHRLPNFLTHSAPLRARESSAKNTILESSSKQRLICQKQETMYVALYGRLSYVVAVVGTIKDCIQGVQNVVGIWKKDRGCLLLLTGRGGRKNGMSNFIFSPPPYFLFRFTAAEQVQVAPLKAKDCCPVFNLHFGRFRSFFVLCISVVMSLSMCKFLAEVVWCSTILALVDHNRLDSFKSSLSATGSHLSDFNPPKMWSYFRSPRTIPPENFCTFV